MNKSDKPDDVMPLFLFRSRKNRQPMTTVAMQTTDDTPMTIQMMMTCTSDSAVTVDDGDDDNDVCGNI